MQTFFSCPERRLDPPEPKVVCRCKYCQDDILEGDEIVSFDGYDYHSDCFMEAAAGILLEQHIATFGYAGRADGYEG